METNIERIRTLRKAATDAMADFRGVIKAVTRAGLYEESESTVSHDNVRIVESDSIGFVWNLDREKHQVVIILTGTWTMKHGMVERELSPTDTIKVPMGSPCDTLMTTDDVGAKFVYAQFKM